MSVQNILEEINKMPTQKGRKVAVAFSGGVDSSLAIPLLRHIYCAKEVIPITIDLGQGDEELQEVHDKAGLLKITPLIIDAKRWCAHAAKIRDLPCKILAKRESLLAKAGGAA